MGKKSPSSKCSVGSEDSGSGLKRQVIRYPKDGYFAIVDPKGLCPSIRSANKCFDKNTLILTESKEPMMIWGSGDRDKKKKNLRNIAPTIPSNPMSDCLPLLVCGQTTMTNTPAKSTEKGSGTGNLSKEISKESQRNQYPTLISLQQDFPVKVFPLLEGVKVLPIKQGELFSGRFSECLELKDHATYCLKMLKDYFHMRKEGLSLSYSFHWMNLGMMLNGRSSTLSIGYHRTGRGSLSSVSEGKTRIQALRWQRTEKGKKARKKSQRKGRDYTPFNEGNRELIPSKEDVSGCVTYALNKDALVLSDILEEKVDKKYYLSKRMIEKIMEKKDAHPDIRWKSGIKGEGAVAFPDDPNKPSRTITPGEGSVNRMVHGILISRKEGIIKKIDTAYAINRSDFRGLNRNQEQNAVLVDRGKIRETGISTSLDSNYWKGPDNHAQRTLIKETKNGVLFNPQIIEIIAWDDKDVGGGDHKKSSRNKAKIHQGKKDVGSLDKPFLIHNKYGGFKGSQRQFYDYSPCIRTPKGGGHLPDVVEGEIANTVDVDGYLRRGKRDRDKDGKAILTSITERRIRRLTPRECERLQGFPDDWTKVPAIGNDAGIAVASHPADKDEVIVGKIMSDTQRYKMMGNAVSVPVIEAIGKRIIDILT